ncbi:pseudouridine synthase [Salinispira pacifica]
MAEPHVVAADDWLLAVWKPAGLHTAPLAEGESDTLVSWVCARFPEVGAVRGRKSIEPGLLHRLDRDTQGLVLFARTQPSFDSLLAASAEGAFEKRYSALSTRSNTPPPGLNSLMPLPSGSQPWRVVSGFRPYGPGRRLVAAVPAGGSRPTQLYETLILSMTERDGRVHLHLSITRGFRHQIRVHLASVGLPIMGDPLYAQGRPGGDAGGGLRLAAIGLSFPHPASGAHSFITAADPWRSGTSA